MARFVEIEAKTVDEAIEMALEQLGIELEDADVEILDNGSKAVLGIFGGKGAKVKVTENISETKVLGVYLDLIIDSIRKEDEEAPKYSIIKKEEGGQKIIDVQITGSDVASLIGKHGDTLYAINYIANLLVNKDKEVYSRVNIDVENYKKHREDTLINMAKRAADRVSKYKRPVILDPMSPAERRVIHMALQNNKNVITESHGEEPNRCVTVKLRPYVKKI